MKFLLQNCRTLALLFPKQLPSLNLFRLRSRKFSKIIFTSFISLLITHYSLPIANAQLVLQEWVRTYNSPDNMGDHFADMVLDHFGSIYLTGWNNTQSEGNNIVTIKYNSAGIQQWATSYNTSGGTSIDFAFALAVDSSGNSYVVGFSGYNFGPYDAILIKLNSSGDTS